MEVNITIEIKTYDETFSFLAEEMSILQIMKLSGFGLDMPQGKIQGLDIDLADDKKIVCALANQTYSYKKDSFAANVIHHFKDLLGLSVQFVSVDDNA